jgi:hypothetical protein
VTNTPPASAAGPTQSKPATGGTAAHIEQRIADLQGMLQITPAQKPRWDQFTEIMRDSAREMDKVFQARAQSMMSMAAEENMKSNADIASRHAQNVQRLVPAFDPPASTIVTTAMTVGTGGGEHVTGMAIVVPTYSTARHR